MGNVLRLGGTDVNHAASRTSAVEHSHRTANYLQIRDAVPINVEQIRCKAGGIVERYAVIKHLNSAYSVFAQYPLAPNGKVNSLAVRLVINLYSRNAGQRFFGTHAARHRLEPRRRDDCGGSRIHLERNIEARLDNIHLLAHDR